VNAGGAAGGPIQKEASMVEEEHSADPGAPAETTQVVRRPVMRSDGVVCG